MILKQLKYQRTYLFVAELYGMLVKANDEGTSSERQCKNWLSNDPDF